MTKHLSYVALAAAAVLLTACGGSNGGPTGGTSVPTVTLPVQELMTAKLVFVDTSNNQVSEVVPVNGVIQMSVDASGQSCAKFTLPQVPGRRLKATIVWWNGDRTELDFANVDSPRERKDCLGWDHARRVGTFTSSLVATETGDDLATPNNVSISFTVDFVS